jgi:hypothetical protein
MAGANFVLDKGFVAGEALSQYHFVTLETTEMVEMGDAQGELCIGVVQNEVTAGDATNGRVVDVRLLGISVVKSGGTITAGQRLTTTAAGRAEPALTGDFVLAIALTPAASGDLFPALLVPSGYALP